MNKINKKFLFTSFISVFILSLFSKVATATSGTADIAKTLGFVATALGALLKFDFQTFFDNILKAVPLLGVFLAIYGLIWFVGVISIFKQKDHSKFAHMFALGVSLAVIFQGSLYSTLMKLSSTFLYFIAIIAFVFMSVIVWNYFRTAHLKGSTAKWNARGENISVKHDDKKIERNMRKDLDGAETLVGSAINNVKQGWRESVGSEKDTEKELAINNKLDKLDANDKNIESLIDNQMGTLNSLDSSIESLVRQLKTLSERPDADNSEVMRSIESLTKYLKDSDSLVSPMIKELKGLFSDFVTESKEDRVQSKLTHDKLIKQLDLARKSSDENIRALAKDISSKLEHISKDISLINSDDSVIDSDLQKEISQLKIFDKNLKRVANNLQLYSKSHSRSDLETIFHQIINLKQELSNFRLLETDVKNRSSQIFALRKQLSGLLSQLEQEEVKEVKEEKEDVHEEKKLGSKFLHEIISLKGHAGSDKFESELAKLRSLVAKEHLDPSAKNTLEKHLQIAIDLDKRMKSKSS